LINTEDPLAITYNDISPLENMHCSTAFAIAKSTGVLAPLPAQNLQMFRKAVVSMVLCTDLAQHFSSLGMFKAKMRSSEAIVASRRGESQELTTTLAVMMDDAEARQQVLNMCIKNSDIGHAAKPWAQHEQWSKRVLEEFFLQGGKEAAQGLSISSLCDRETTDVWKSQLGFIDFLAMPQAKVWCSFLGSDRVSTDVLKNVKNNRQMWASLEKQAASMEPYKDQKQLQDTFFERR
jgi:cAMP-specific phosphodiesterase 4